MVITMMGINDHGAHIPYEAISNARFILFFRSLRIYKLTRLLWLHIVTKIEETEPILFKKAIELNPMNDEAYQYYTKKWANTSSQGDYGEKIKEFYYNPVTVNNYRKLKKILDKESIQLVCVQYPMCSVEPLKKIFEREEGLIFVDNERVFKEALKRSTYKEYFTDMIGSNFGHCTERGNRLLAENIANVILKEVFGK